MYIYMITCALVEESPKFEILKHLTLNFAHGDIFTRTASVIIIAVVWGCYRELPKKNPCPLWVNPEN